MTTSSQNDSERSSWVFDKLSEKRVAQATNFKAQPDDVFIVSYPKSGTTWLISIVNYLMAGEQGATGSLFNDIPVMLWAPILETNPVEEVEAPVQAGRTRRLFKSHLPFTVMPSVGERRAEKSAKCIYIARNPKDIATSYFHHHHLFTSMGYSGDWSDFFEKFINGDVAYRSWFDHVQGWWEHRNDENVLFIKYEDMKKDARKCAEQVASFLSISVSADVIDFALEQSSFNKMQAMDVNRKIVPENNPIYTTKEGGRFVRKGMVGDWKSLFTAEQNAKVDELYAQLQAKCPGLDFTFE